MMTRCALLLLLSSAASLVLRGNPKAELKDQDEAVLGNLDDPVDKIERELDEEKIANFEPSTHLVSFWSMKKPYHKPPALNVIEEDANTDTIDAIIDAERLPEECMKSIRAKEAVHKQCADPWTATRDCQKPYEIPGYRLGDLFYGYAGLQKNAKWTSNYFPESIGAKYLSKHPKGKRALLEVLDSAEYADYDKPNNSTVVVHMRGFDGMLQKKFAGYQRGMSHYEKMSAKAAASGLTKAVIVTGDHRITQSRKYPKIGGAKTDGTQLTDKEVVQAVEMTKGKVAEIKKLFESKGLTVETHFNWNADCDFVYMANSKHFVPSHGTFDDLIVAMLKSKGGSLL